MGASESLQSPHRAIVVGTAGHIDHGKTSLVKALTGVDTDRLKEEKERGITIDIGFASLVLPSGHLISIVDVPGHERFIRNMVAGASGIDLVMLVISADEGVMPQTREHLEICEFLGIKNGFVVLTKADLVDEEWLEFVKEEVREFLKGTFLEGAPIIPFSAVTLQGREEILKVLEEMAIKVRTKDLEQPFRMPVDGVFTVKGFGLIVRGTALSGEVRLNQELMLYPQKRPIKVRNIQVHGTNRERAQAGMRVALNITGVEKEEVSRGDVVAEPGVLEPSQWLDVKIKTIKDLEPPLRNFENLLLYIGTAEITAKLILFVRERLEAQEEDVAQLFLQKPAVCWRGDRFILRRPGTNQTVAGGWILNPVSSRRRKTKPWEKRELEILASDNIPDLILYLLDKKGALGLNRGTLALSLSIFGKKLEDELDKLRENILILTQGEEVYLFTRKSLEDLKEEILLRLKKYHESNPFSPGLSKEALRARLGIEAREIAFEKALEELIEEGRIVRERELYSLSDFKSLSSGEAENLKWQIEQKFLREGLTPRDFEEILLDFKDNYQAVTELTKVLLREGRLVKLTDKLVYHRQVLEEVKEKVLEFFKKKSELTVGDFRNLLGEGISRKYLIPLLEYLDKEKITLRLGDKRVLRKR